jgi:hypothetical protein
MTTLVWLFFGMACLVSMYITYRVCRWYYGGVIHKLENELAELE